MAESNREFGDLLSQGLRSIAARENKPILTLEDLLGAELGVTRSSIEKWRQGSIIPDEKKIDYLARVSVRRGGQSQSWLGRFLTQARFPDKEALIRELFPSNGQIEAIIHRNFPGRHYEKFVGREQDLARLKQFLSPRHRLGVICLSGAAGVGKTALAVEIAHFYYEHYTMFPPDERFEAIVWVTAKQMELLPKRAMPRRPTFTDLEGVYRALAEVLGLPAITRAATAEDRDIVVSHVLSERRILLLIDNLEDIDDPDLMVFLRDLPTPSKAIVTTRHRIDVAVTLQLHAFKEAEARELIRIECHKHELSVTHEQAEKLLQRTGGLALAIVRTIGRMAWHRSSIEAELQQLGNPANSIYDFCFEKSIALIRGGDAHKLLMALALFASDATRDALGFIVGFKEGIFDRDEGLSVLEVLSLVNKEDDRFSLEVLTRVKAQAELTANPSSERGIRERWIEWYGELATQAEDSMNFPSLKPEIPNLISVIDWLIVQGQMSKASWFFQRSRRILYAQGQWESLLSLAEQLASWAESTDNPEILAESLQVLIRATREHGNFTYAAAWLERIQLAAARLGNELLQAEVWLAQGEISYDHKAQHLEMAEPIMYATRALEVFRRWNRAERLVNTFNTLGNIYLKQESFEQAIRFYREGIDILDNADPPIYRNLEWRAALRGNSGIAVGRQGRYAESCQILLEVLKDLTDLSDFAEVYVILALHRYRLGDTEQALLFRRQADQIIEHMNLARPLCLEDEEWVRLGLL